MWLVSWKRATGRPAPTYDDVVEEALCVGWIDSRASGLDAERSMLLMTPRRPGSAWARSNKERVARLQADGSMTPAGQRVVDAAIADGSWTILDAVERLEVPDDLAAALDARPGSRATWDGFAPSVRRAALWWIVQAKRPATREARVVETAERAARGERPHS